MENGGNIIPASRLKRLSDRIKELERYQARDKYGFDFNIIQRLKTVLVVEETRDDESKISYKYNISDTIKQGPNAIIDRILLLKEQEVNAFSKKVKTSRRDEIEKLKQHMVNVSSPSDSTVLSGHLENILNLFIKYLEIKHYSYDKEELRAFLNNELYRN